MDPYLEDPQIWPGVHSALVVYIGDHLQPLLRRRYDAPCMSPLSPDDQAWAEGLIRREVPADG